VIGRYGDAWKIRVTAAPERGRANDELTKYLAQLLGISRSAVVVSSGAAARDKTLVITGVSDVELQTALERASNA